MTSPDLLKYISKELKSGKPKEQVRFSLMQSGGWRISDLDEAFAHLEHPELFKVQRHFPFGKIVFLLVLVGGGYFAMQYFNIHSVQDIKDRFIPPLAVDHIDFGTATAEAQ